MDQRLAKYVESELGALNGGSLKVLPKFYVPKAAPWHHFICE